MLIQIVAFLCGLFFIVKGADWLVDGSSAVAKRLGISDFVIGLTIVGMGTSAPEIAGRGMINKIKEIADEANILAIDYDASASKVNQENRIKLMLATAK